MNSLFMNLYTFSQLFHFLRRFQSSPLFGLLAVKHSLPLSGFLFGNFIQAQSSSTRPGASGLTGQRSQEGAELGMGQ